jgi:hypothetical protein
MPVGAAGGSTPAVTPVPATVARSVHIASAALPAAGAFTSQGAYTPAAGVARFVSFWITYTRGAAGGYPKFHLEWGNGTETALEVSFGEASAVQPYLQQNVYQGELLGPTPTDGNAISYVLTVENTKGATQVRLLAAEAGITATPGTIAIAITGSGQ